jgi:hypothetical protein
MYSRFYAVGEYTTTVYEQRLGKHIPAETIKHATVCYVVRAGLLWAVRFEATSSVELCKEAEM